MSTGKKIAIGAIIVFLLLCAAFMAFVNWSNSDAGQQTFKEVETRQAIESATAAVQAAQDAQSTAQAAGTATAVMAGIQDRLQNAKLVFENNFDEGTPILSSDGKEISAYYRDGIPEITVTWNGYYVVPIQKDLTDFVAEVDCMASGAFCGIAYGVHMTADADVFYASGIGSTDNYFFDDHTKSFTSTNWSYSNFAQSPAAPGLHRLRTEKFGQNMRFYVNGQLIEERILENPAALSGDVGFYFGKANEDSGIQYIQVDNFKVWELP